MVSKLINILLIVAVFQNLRDCKKLKEVQEEIFDCPIKSGSIIAPTTDPFDFRTPSETAIITGKDSIVYSITSGEISIKEDSNRITVFLNHNRFLIAYRGFKKLLVKPAMEIKSGDVIGILKEGENLHLSILKDNVPVTAASYLSCK